MCKHFVHVHIRLRFHESEPAMEDHAMVVCCTFLNWDHVDIDEFRHFMTKSTCAPFGAGRQIQKDITLLFYVMLASKSS